jgi:polysaccharide biosynthesis protein PslJ
MNAFAARATHPSRPPALGVPPRAALLLLPACAALGLGAALFPLPVAAAALVCFGLALLFVLPIESLPALTMLWLALVPVNDLPLPSAARVASPAVAILAVWFLRREVGGLGRAETRLPSGIKWTSLALVGWLAITTIATISASRSLVWDLCFGVSILAPLGLRLNRREARLAIDALVYVGIALAAFAVVEYLLHRNPLLGHLYREAPFPIEQRWSTYRVTTLLGHPLNNALFFSAAAAAGFARYLETRRALYAGGFLLALVALLLTGSRGALYLTPVVLVLVVGLEVRAGALTMRRLGRLALIAGLALAALFALYSQTVGLRADSTEAHASTDVRYRALDESLHIAGDNDYLGTGPGTSNSAKEEDILNPGDVDIAIENSYLQLLVSIGIPGVALVLALLGAVVWAGYRRGNIAAAGALAAMALVIGTYNFIEGVRPDLLFLGLLGACCLAAPATAKEDDDAPAL